MLTIRVDAKYISGVVGVLFFEYATNRRTAIDLVDPVTQERLCRATVNVRDVRDLAPDEVILKGWAENEGVPEALMAAGLVGSERGRVYLTHVDATIHKLLRRE